MQVQQENIVLDTVENADGLEQLVVVCVDLDAPVERNLEDLQTLTAVQRFNASATFGYRGQCEGERRLAGVFGHGDILRIF